MDSSINFKVKIDDWEMEFVLEGDELNISGVNQKLKNKPKSESTYNAFYDTLSLPQKIYDEFQSSEELTMKIMKYKKTLKIVDDSLIIQTQKNKEAFVLPLKGKNEQLEFTLQANTQILPHPIKVVPKSDSLPYSAAVFIVANCSNIANITSSGVLIGQTTVLTVAHAVYSRQENLQADKVQVFALVKGQLKRIKVKNHFFREQYKTTNLTDLPKYDFAILELENNNIITKDMILPIKWNWTDSCQVFQVVGFSKKLDQKFQHNCQKLYHMKSRPIARFQSFVTYDNKAQSGISGAPLIIFQDNQYKVIGLHQGLHINFSRGLLLSSFSQNPYQILRNLFTTSNMPMNILANAQSEWSTLKEHPQVKKISSQYQKLKLQQEQKDKKLQKLLRQNNQLKQKQKMYEITAKKQKTQPVKVVYKQEVKKPEGKQISPTKKIEVQVKSQDNMPTQQKNLAINCSKYALSNFKTESQQAKYIKMQLDKKSRQTNAKQTWFVIVGTNFGSYTTNDKCLFLKINDVYIFAWQNHQKQKN